MQALHCSAMPFELNEGQKISFKKTEKKTKKQMKSPPSIQTVIQHMPGNCRLVIKVNIWAVTSRDIKLQMLWTAFKAEQILCTLEGP